MENFKINSRKFQGNFDKNSEKIPEKFEKILTECDDSYIEDLEIQELLKSLKNKE